MQNVGKRFLTATWRHIVMLNYEVDPEILTDYIPRGTSVDRWRDRAFISMIGFQFLNTKLLGLRIPFYGNFDEVNLRLYVRRETSREIRRGVAFIKEIVPHRLTAWIARNFYNERYVAMSMRHRDEIESSGKVTYEWRTGGRWHRLGVLTTGLCKVPSPESEESFITEHYWGYARQPDGTTLEYQVEHPPWKVFPTKEAIFDCDISSIYGGDFVPFLSTPPSSAFLAEGSRVVVRRGLKIEL